MDNMILEGIEFMGRNVKDKLRMCGLEVNIFPLAKIVKPENVAIGDYSQVFDYAFIHGGGSVIIGNYTTITWHSIIEGFGEVTIGDGVLIALGVKIISSLNEHNGYRVGERIPKNQVKKRVGKIVIENEAVIGVGSVIMPNTTIGEGAVVGANSLVIKDLDPWGIYVGNPCKKIGDRGKPKL